MATPRVRANTTNDWVNVIGAASGVAKTTWQNIGAVALAISFNATKPTGAEAIMILQPGQAYYDETGSTACWVQASSTTTVCATSA